MQSRGAAKKWRRLHCDSIKNAIPGVSPPPPAPPHVILTRDDGAALSTRDVGFNQRPQNKKRAGRSISIFDSQSVYFGLWPSVKLIFFFFLSFFRGETLLGSPQKALAGGVWWWWWWGEWGTPGNASPPHRFAFKKNDSGLRVQASHITLLSKSKGTKKRENDCKQANKQTHKNKIEASAYAAREEEEEKLGHLWAA